MHNTEYPRHGGGRIKRYSLIAAFLLLCVAVVLPVDEVNAVGQNLTNQTCSKLSNMTQSDSNPTISTQKSTKKKVATSSETPDVPEIQSYTYYVKIPYKTIKVRVHYWKKYTKTIRTPVKKWYYSSYYDKYKYYYVYRYKYVTTYKKAHKWVKKTKYKKVAKIGYFNNSEYLKSTDNCDIYDPSIQKLSKDLTNNTNSTFKKATKVFQWVRDNIKYSFYYNTKKGAVKTLATKSANCCDHSHLVVALARSAGIPARYVHGKCVFNSGTRYGHVWAQLFVNGKWYDADATSYRNSLGTIKNWNTETANIKGHYTELPF